MPNKELSIPPQVYNDPHAAVDAYNQLEYIRGSLIESGAPQEKIQQIQDEMDLIASLHGDTFTQIQDELNAGLNAARDEFGLDP